MKSRANAARYRFMRREIKQKQKKGRKVIKKAMIWPFSKDTQPQISLFALFPVWRKTILITTGVGGAEVVPNYLENGLKGQLPFFY